MLNWDKKLAWSYFLLFVVAYAISLFQMYKIFKNNVQCLRLLAVLGRNAYRIVSWENLLLVPQLFPGAVCRFVIDSSWVQFYVSQLFPFLFVAGIFLSAVEAVDTENRGESLSQVKIYREFSGRKNICRILQTCLLKRNNFWFFKGGSWFKLFVFCKPSLQFWFC